MTESSPRSSRKVVTTKSRPRITSIPGNIQVRLSHISDIQQLSPLSQTLVHLVSCSSISIDCRCELSLPREAMDKALLTHMETGISTMPVVDLTEAFRTAMETDPELTSLASQLLRDLSIRPAVGEQSWSRGTRFSILQRVIHLALTWFNSCSETGSSVLPHTLDPMTCSSRGQAMHTVSPGSWMLRQVILTSGRVNRLSPDPSRLYLQVHIAILSEIPLC